MTCTTDFRDLAVACAELTVNVGIIQAAINNNEGIPEEVRDNLSEKIETLCEYIASQSVEFQGFAEFFDRD